MMVMVRVRASYRWNNAQVAGQEFTKAGTVMPEAALNAEIRRSVLLEIIPMGAEPGQPVRKRRAR